MINSNSVSSSSVMSAKSSAVLSSSKSAASTAHSNSVAKTSQKVAPRTILPLKERTSVKKIRPNVELLNITERTGSKVEVYLVAPSYKEAERIDDARQVMMVSGGHTYLRLTTPAYQEKLFSIMRNLEVDGKPSKMGWKLANSHIEAFNWIMAKANSFLGNYFNPAED